MMAILKTFIKALSAILLVSQVSGSFLGGHHHEHHHKEIEVRSESNELEARSTSQTPAFAYNVLWNLHQAFYTAFIYPNNVKQAQSVNSSLLAPNVIGRVDITRVFTGQELNTEYLFGLFTGQTLNAGAAALLGVPIAFDVIHFAASSYVVSSQVVVTFNLSSIQIPVRYGRKKSLLFWTFAD